MSERELNSSSKFNKIKKPSAVLAGLLAATALSACGEKVSGEPTETKTVTATAEPTPNAETTTQPVEVSQDLSPEAIAGKPPVEITANSLNFPDTYSANLLLHQATPEKALNDYQGWRELVTSPITLTPEEMADEDTTSLSIANNIDARVIAVMNAGRTAEDVKDCTDFTDETCAENIGKDYEVADILKENMTIPETADAQQSDAVEAYNAFTSKHARRNTLNYCNEDARCRIVSQAFVEKDVGINPMVYEEDPAGGFTLSYDSYIGDNPIEGEVSAFYSNPTYWDREVTAKGVINKQTGEITIKSIDTQTNQLENTMVF